jgi:Uma2 family endonuclease
MDTALAPSKPVPLPRRRFTSAEVERMVQLGILTQDDHVELIHGELIEMGRQGEAHWRAVQRIVNWFSRRVAEAVSIASQGPIRLADGEEPEPDLYLFPTGMDVNAVRGPDAQLVVEIADTSIEKDKLVKAPLYAAYGVREYWIVDLGNRVTLVYRGPTPAGYLEPDMVSFDAPLTAPGITQPLILTDVL